MGKKQDTNKNPLCIVAGCAKYEHARGLCAAHYAQALAGVKRGEVTWKQLEKSKKALPERSPGRPKTTPFYKASAK